MIEFLKGLYNKLSKKHDPLYHAFYGRPELAATGSDPGRYRFGRFMGTATECRCDRLWADDDPDTCVCGKTRCEIRPNHLGLFFYPKNLIKKVISESGMEDVYKLARKMREYLGIKDGMPYEKRVSAGYKIGTLNRDSSYNPMSRGVPTQFGGKQCQ